MLIAGTLLTSTQIFIIDAKIRSHVLAFLVAQGKRGDIGLALIKRKGIADNGLILVTG
jgi:hypothetical protein